MQSLSPFPILFVSLLCPTMSTQPMTDKKATSDSQRPSTAKTLYLVRHGESLHNARVIPNANLDDMRYIDSPLTPKGISQAKALQRKFESYKPKLIICSPMTRAIQTCYYATSTLEPFQQPLVHPLCTERLSYSCDIGSPCSILQKKFPHLDFHRLDPPNAWWYQPDYIPRELGTAETSYRFMMENNAREPSPYFYRRVAHFLKWIDQRPENSIAVFAHGVFLAAMQHGHLMHNCEVRILVR